MYGILLKYVFNYLNYGIFGFLMFIALLSVLYNYDSIVSGTLVNVFRYSFIYPILFFLVFAKFRR
jgi:hypothetical protein